MIADNLATFIHQAHFEELSANALKQLKIRLLDSLGTAIGAVEGPPVQAIRQMIRDFGGSKMSTLTGGSRTTPDYSYFIKSHISPFNVYTYAPTGTATRRTIPHSH